MYYYCEYGALYGIIISNMLGLSIFTIRMYDVHTPAQIILSSCTSPALIYSKALLVLIFFDDQWWRNNKLWICHRRAPNWKDSSINRTPLHLEAKNVFVHGTMSGAHRYKFLLYSWEMVNFIVLWSFKKFTETCRVVSIFHLTKKLPFQEPNRKDHE